MWKEIVVYVGLLGISGNILAQDGKAPGAVKSIGKQPLQTVSTQPQSSRMKVVRPSFNPDLPPKFGPPGVVELKRL